MAPGLVPQRFSVIHADDLANLMILAAQRGSRMQPAAEDDGHAGGCLLSGNLFCRLRRKSHLRRTRPHDRRGGRTRRTPSC